MAAEPLQFIVDQEGKTTSVVVPIAHWSKLNEKLKQLQAKQKVLKGIRSGLEEVQSAKQSGKKLESLSSFLK